MELVGIAKLAAEGRELEAKRATSYFELAARSYLTRCANKRMPFRWMINPYRGCEFACKYCYARYTHEFMELRDPYEFERKIFAKSFEAGKFLRELKQLDLGETVAIGTATDPYQPAERRFQVTRQMLEVLAETAGLRIGITTKSNLIARDAALLREVSRRHELTIMFTVTTVDAELARRVEPLAPRPDLRLAACRTLTDAGVRCTVFCAPVLPLINDRPQQLRALAEAAKEAGAAWFGANVLFLKSSAKEVFFPWLEERFPALVRRYRERYGDHTAYLRGAYPELIEKRVQALRDELWADMEPPPQPELWPRDPQLLLFVQ